MIDELGRELSAVGIHGVRRERILAELADHLACDSAADLGDPRELAQQFADELGTSLARRAAVWAFAALALVAPLLFVPLFLVDTYPDIAGGLSPILTALALIALFVGAQVAFVAGSLAALRAWRVRSEPALPAAEVGLLRRRSTVAVAAGVAAATGLALYAVNLWGDLPSWWATVAVAFAAAACIPLAVASRAIAAAGRPVVKVEGAAAGLIVDLGQALAGVGAGGVTLLAGTTVAVVACAGGWLVEGSVQEAALRGAVEATAFGVCWVALGRTLGVRAR